MLRFVLDKVSHSTEAFLKTMLYRQCGKREKNQSLKSPKMMARPGDKDQAKCKSFHGCKGLNRILVDNPRGR